MLRTTLIACVLVAITVAVHAVGFALLLRALMKSCALTPTRFWPITWLLIRVAWPAADTTGHGSRDFPTKTTPGTRFPAT